MKGGCIRLVALPGQWLALCSCRRASVTGQVELVLFFCSGFQQKGVKKKDETTMKRESAVVTVLGFNKEGNNCQVNKLRWERTMPSCLNLKRLNARETSQRFAQGRIIKRSKPDGQPSRASIAAINVYIINLHYR